MIYENDDFIYDSETGELFHGRDKGYSKRSRENSPCPGKPRPDGYLVVGCGDDGPLLQHRLAWYLAYEEIPKRLFHLNGDRSDNRLDNLVDVGAADYPSDRDFEKILR